MVTGPDGTKLVQLYQLHVFFYQFAGVNWSPDAIEQF